MIDGPTAGYSGPPPARTLGLRDGSTDLTEHVPREVVFRRRRARP